MEIVLLCEGMTLGQSTDCVVVLLNLQPIQCAALEWFASKLQGLVCMVFCISFACFSYSAGVGGPETFSCRPALLSSTKSLVLCSDDWTSSYGGEM